MMKENKLESLLIELKAKVKESSGKIKEGELIKMINIIARTEMEMKQNAICSSEEFENEIMKLLEN